MKRSCCCVALALASMLLAASAADAATAVPEVTGPLPASEASHPFGGAQWQLRAQDLSEHGYVEEEYLVSGTANVYEWGAGNQAVVRTCRTRRTRPACSCAGPRSRSGSAGPSWSSRSTRRTSST